MSASLSSKKEREREYERRVEEAKRKREAEARAKKKRLAAIADPSNLETTSTASSSSSSSSSSSRRSKSRPKTSKARKDKKASPPAQRYGAKQPRPQRDASLALTSDGDVSLSGAGDDDGDESPPPSPPPPPGKEKRSLIDRFRGLGVSSPKAPPAPTPKTKKQLAKEKKEAEERRHEQELAAARRRERDAAEAKRAENLEKQRKRAKPKLKNLLKRLDDDEDDGSSSSSSAVSSRRRAARVSGASRRSASLKRRPAKAASGGGGGGGGGKSGSGSKERRRKQARQRGAQTPRPSRGKSPLKRSNSARALSEAGSSSSDDSDDSGSEAGMLDARRALFPKAMTESERRRRRESAPPPPPRPRHERFPYPAPRDSSGAYRGAVGLRNLGNTCFMNSCLQCLCSLPPLIQYFDSGAYEGHINKRLSPLRGQLAKDFGGLMRAVRGGADGSVERPVKVKRTVAMIAPRFAGYGQQDVQEFLQFLLDGLSDDLNRVQRKPEYVEIKDEEGDSDRVKSDRWWRNYLERNDSFVSDLFAGQLKSEVVCASCRHVSTAFDPFWNISVPIPKKARNSTGMFKATASCSLMRCFEAFTEPEMLVRHDQYYCSRCKKHRDSRKQLSVYRFPHVLVVHIKRFGNASILSRVSSSAKLTTNIEFPLEGLDLSHFSPPNHPQEAVYDLFAVANHTGSLGGGHYTSFAKVSDDDWFFFNDSRCQPVSPNSIPGPAAYVLFYERRSTVAK